MTKDDDLSEFVGFLILKKYDKVAKIQAFA